MMKGFKRFALEVVVRDWDSETDREGPEKSYKVNRTSRSEHELRRHIVRDTLLAGQLVSSIRVLSVKDS